MEASPSNGAARRCCEFLQRPALRHARGNRPSGDPLLGNQADFAFSSYASLLSRSAGSHPARGYFRSRFRHRRNPAGGPAAGVRSHEVPQRRDQAGRAAVVFRCKTNPPVIPSEARNLSSDVAPRRNRYHTPRAQARLLAGRSTEVHALAGVVSWLLPKALHQHFYNVYAYCRWADDLGDEVPEAARALDLLRWWGRELDACYEGKPSHPVFIALRETVLAKDIPKQPFADLLKAFRQDQTVKRYSTWDAVLGYCVYSANPVGRLVLYLCGYRDEQRQLLSDATCTALQLANFWQDVSRDLDIGRIYIPFDAAAAHGLSESDIVERRFDDRYVLLMKDLIARTRALFAEGQPLAKMVDGRLSVDLEMFTRGGLAVLDAIETMGYDTLHHRPA